MRPVQKGVWDVFSLAINYKENRTLFLSQPKQEILQNLPRCFLLTSYIRIETKSFLGAINISKVFFHRKVASYANYCHWSNSRSLTDVSWQQDTCTVNEIILNLVDCSCEGANPLAFTCSLWAYLGACSMPDNQNWFSRLTCNVFSFEIELNWIGWNFQLSILDACTFFNFYRTCCF